MLLRMASWCLYTITKVTPSDGVDPRTETMTRGEYLFERVNEWLDEWFGNVNEGKVYPSTWADGRYRSETLPPEYTKWKPWKRVLS